MCCTHDFVPVQPGATLFLGSDSKQEESKRKWFHVEAKKGIFRMFPIKAKQKSYESKQAKQNETCKAK
jgi:hypothetical protein